MKITCDAENTVESLGGVDEREDIPPGVEGRIDISDRLQMETSSGVESRLEIVPPNVAVFSVQSRLRFQWIILLKGNKYL